MIDRIAIASQLRPKHHNCVQNTLSSSTSWPRSVHSRRVGPSAPAGLAARARSAEDTWEALSLHVGSSASSVHGHACNPSWHDGNCAPDPRTRIMALQLQELARLESAQRARVGACSDCTCKLQNVATAVARSSSARASRALAATRPARLPRGHVHRPAGDNNARKYGTAGVCTCDDCDHGRSPSCRGCPPKRHPGAVGKSSCRCAVGAS